MEPEQIFLHTVVTQLVDEPGAVKIDRTTDEMGVLLTLQVARGDMGKVIGREGATAKAIRTLLRTVGMRNSARVNLKILEPEGPTHSSVVQSSDASEFGRERARESFGGL